MQDRGIISGYPDGAFRTEASVTRGIDCQNAYANHGYVATAEISAAFPDAADHWSAKQADGWLHILADGFTPTCSVTTPPVSK